MDRVSPFVKALPCADLELATHTHCSLGPGTPESTQSEVPESDHRHKMPPGYGVVKTSVLGGLHHEYHLVKEAA